MPRQLSDNFFCALVIAILLSLAGTPAATAAPLPRVTRLTDGTEFREDRILIIPKANRAAELGRFHGQVGARARKSLRRMSNIVVLELPGGVSARDIVERYRRSGHVDAVSLDVVLRACALPDDPLVANGGQWHLNNFGQSSGVFGADIHASEAWEIQNNATNVIVAVVDSGARITHQDLASSLWVNPNEVPGNGIDDDGNGVVDDIHGINAIPNPPTGNLADGAGHGTHVAGIIGARSNNSLGGSGVAPGARIMICKFLNDAGSGFLSDMVQALDYASSEGARIANCSFEIPYNLLNASDFAVMSNAFWNLRSAGVLVTAAAGNSGLDTDLAPRYPACFDIDNIVAVMASSRQDTYTLYNYGLTTVDLAAPGISIYSTYNHFDSEYVPLSGTSMAAPSVAGAAALILAKYPNLSAQQVIRRIKETVDPLPAFATRCVTGGRLNVARALQGGYTIRPATYSWVPTNGMTPLSLTDDGVSGARPLPFTFNFGGKSYTNLYVSANGLVGFQNIALGATGNTDLPTAITPNSIICPLWDNLNPAATGAQVWWGTNGSGTNRSVVATWSNVPHFVTTGGQTRFTFQVILYENQNIRFQYASVESGKPQYIQGLDATIGLEDFMGAVATKYSYLGSSVVTNGQSMLFVPDGTAFPQPTLQYLSGPGVAGYQFLIRGHPSERCIVQGSTNLVHWTGIATNIIAADGTLAVQDLGASALKNRFYRAVMQP